MSMLRTIKPKNARVKRALDKREPQEVEGEKTAIFVRGNSTSDRVRTAMKDMSRTGYLCSSRAVAHTQYALKRPHAINFSRKNDIHPFESASSLEFFSQKNDASLFITGLHSKKRPHDLVFSRTFDGRVLDMIELGIEDIKSMTDFESSKSAVGARPLMVFHSDLFDTHPTYQQLKSTLLDFYGGHAISEISPTALEHVISITAGPLPPTTEGTSAPLPTVHLRVYSLRLLASGTRAPRAELTEMGPSIDFSVRRVQTPDEETMKHALKRPKIAKSAVESGLGKKRKNIETDAMGDRVGKIHMVKQDLDKLQSRKMKGLKVHKEAKRAAAAAADEGAEDDE